MVCAFEPQLETYAARYSSALNLIKCWLPYSGSCFLHIEPPSHVGSIKWGVNQWITFRPSQKKNTLSGDTSRPLLYGLLSFITSWILNRLSTYNLLTFSSLLNVWKSKFYKNRFQQYFSIYKVHWAAMLPFQVCSIPSFWGQNFVFKMSRMVTHGHMICVL